MPELTELALSRLVLLRPNALWLAIPAFIYWLIAARRPLDIAVGSTFIWRRVSGSTARPRVSQFLLLLFLGVAVGALSRPVLLPGSPADPGTHGVLRVVRQPGPQGRLRVEALLPRSALDRTATFTCGAWSETAPVEHRDAGDVDTWEFAAPDLPPGASLHMEVCTSAPATRVEFRAQAVIPPRFTPLAVRDESRSPAVEAALVALCAAGWTRMDDNAPACIVRRATAGSTADAQRAADQPPFLIFLPATDAPETGFLPRARSTIAGHALVRGLDLEHWTILTRQEAVVDARRFDSVWIDSEAGPLLRAGRDSLAFDFDPDRADLIDTAAWPVLWGRLVERVLLRIEPNAPAPSARWRELPRFLLLCVLAVLGWRLAALSSHLRRSLLLSALGAALLVPPLPFGEPRTVAATIDSRHALSAADLDLLPSGGVLRVPSHAAVPANAEAFRSHLRQRQISLAIESPGDAVELVLSASRIEVGGTLTVRVHPPRAGRLVVTGADGARREKSLEADAPFAMQPEVAGNWLCEFQTSDATAAAPATFVVESRPRALLLTNPLAATETRTRGRWLAAAGFELLDAPRAVELAPILVGERAPQLVVWDDAAPERFAFAEFDALRTWIENGGTLLVAAGATFHAESAQKTQLSDLLAQPLPRQPPDDSDYGVVLVDFSGSIRGDALATMLAAVTTALESTPLASRWGVCVFADEPRWIAQPGAPVDAQLVARVLSEQPGGGTHLDRALTAVRTTLSARVGKRSILLVTDGLVERADWSRIGAELAHSQVELAIVALGATAQHSALQELVQAAGGTYAAVGDVRTATSVVRGAIEHPPSPWRDIVGPLRPAVRDPLLRGVPAEIPAPRRAIVTPPLPQRAGVRTLWMDGEGLPSFVERSLGRGSALTWQSSLAAADWPTREAGQALSSALAQVLLASVRDAPTEPRRVELRRDATGGAWIWLERRDGEALVLAAQLRIDGEGTRTIPAAAWERGGYLLARPADARHGVTIEVAPTSSTWIPADSTWDPRPLAEFAASTHFFAPRHEHFSLDFILVVLGVGLACWPSRARSAEHQRRTTAVAADAGSATIGGRREN
ncbi:MAG: VWA domain-containing protein [Planctomycetota bacterium]